MGFRSREAPSEPRAYKHSRRITSGRWPKAEAETIKRTETSQWWEVLLRERPRRGRGFVLLQEAGRAIPGKRKQEALWLPMTNGRCVR